VPKPFSRTPMTIPERLRQKKVCDEKKKKTVNQVHVSEYVLNSMFQVGYRRTLVLFGSIVIEFSVSPKFRASGGGTSTASHVGALSLI